MAVEARAGSGVPTNRGWFAIAWSKTGYMFPADAVVGVAGSSKPAAYAIEGYSGTTVGPTSRFSLGNTALASGTSGIVMRFTRNGTDGAVPVKHSGANQIIWAFGSSSRPTDHGMNRGGKAVDFSCLPAPSSSPPPPPPPKPSPPPSAPPCKPSACKRSSLPGYTASVDLTGKGFVLHWKRQGRQSLSVAVEAKASSGAHKGWFALGWSKTGSMFPADVAVGNLATSASPPAKSAAAVAAYGISGYAASAVKPSSKFVIGPIGFSSTAKGAIMRFSRNKTDGSVPVKYKGVNRIIWAFSPDGSKTVGYHKNNWGTKAVDFGCVPCSNAIK
ncbi:hypothetical protein CLOM_g24312 [Closterium sp. NIES-68]|nr:hypothetical protein CLOM_g24312 [Closterium sp. NIES-68]GJP59851.1 hypothetical protein CLOP_g15475 [Closterium sp. NIES-67]